MLIHKVHTSSHTWEGLFPYKRSLQSVGPSSFTLLGWFRLSSIDQYSSLLPPVGVWTVSQFQCGGPSSQNPYPSKTRWAVTRLLSNGTHPHHYTGKPLIMRKCLLMITSCINLPFRRLSKSVRQVGYALLTRAPVAIGLSKLRPCCPSTCMC